jgi:hypothetical protein
VIIGDMNATLLGSTVVASVASVVVERSILGGVCGAGHHGRSRKGRLAARRLFMLSYFMSHRFTRPLAGRQARMSPAAVSS